MLDRTRRRCIEIPNTRNKQEPEELEERESSDRHPGSQLRARCREAAKHPADHDKSSATGGYEEGESSAPKGGGEGNEKRKKHPQSLAATGLQGC